MTFNIEGFFRNNFYLTSLIQNISPKLIFLQEIWAPYSLEASMDKMYPDYSIQISTPDMFTPPEDLLTSTGHTWHGSAIMWHASLDPYIYSLKTTNARFTSVRFVIQDKTFLAVSIYFPTGGKDDEYLECVSDLTNFVHDKLKVNEVILIGTDSNCSEKSSSRRRQALLKLCQVLDLVKVSTSQPTFHHHNGMSESIIDYFLISKEYVTNLENLDLLCTLNSPENLSSHES